MREKCSVMPLLGCAAVVGPLPSGPVPDWRAAMRKRRAAVKLVHAA